MFSARRSQLSGPTFGSAVEILAALAAAFPRQPVNPALATLTNRPPGRVSAAELAEWLTITQIGDDFAVELQGDRREIVAVRQLCGLTLRHRGDAAEVLWHIVEPVLRGSNASWV